MVGLISKPLLVIVIWAYLFGSTLLMYESDFIIKGFEQDFFSADIGFPLVRISHKTCRWLIGHNVHMWIASHIAHKWPHNKLYDHTYINAFGFVAYAILSSYCFMCNILYSIIALYAIYKSLLGASPTDIPLWVHYLEVFAAISSVLLDLLLCVLNRLFIAIHRLHKKRTWRK